MAGTAVCDDGVVIDLSAMRALWVDPAGRGFEGLEELRDDHVRLVEEGCGGRLEGAGSAPASAGARREHGRRRKPMITASAAPTSSKAMRAPTMVLEVRSVASRMRPRTR